MMNDLHTPQIPLFSELEEPQNYEVYVYGTDDLIEQHTDSFSLAIGRYLGEIGTLAGSVTCFRSCCMRCLVSVISVNQINISSGHILTVVPLTSDIR